MPWDTESPVPFTICNTTDKIAETELEYSKLVDVHKKELVNMTGCSLPCIFIEFKLLGIPRSVPSDSYELKLSFAETEAVEEEEAYVYDLVSFISEVGGALGLFLGFSFLGCWDMFGNLCMIVCKKKKIVHNE